MAKKKPRYWVYSHDRDGLLIENISDCDELRDAIDSAASYLMKLYPQYSGVTVRVVDNDLDHGTTVWLAGPAPKPDDRQSRPF